MCGSDQEEHDKNFPRKITLPTMKTNVPLQQHSVWL